jgi:hypothetical protein
LTQQQQANAIYVTNIASTATIKQVSEFFSYCGNIEKIVQEFDPSSPQNDQKQFAVVVFDSDQAYSVALLLGSSVIEGSPINVHPYSNVTPSTSSTSADGKNSRSAVSVVASLVASGYVTGEHLINDMKNQAKELDSHVGAGAKVKHAYNVSIEKCKKIDSDYKFTETLSSLKNKAVETTRDVYKTVDHALGLEQKAKEAKDFTVKTANKAMEFQPVKQSVEVVSAGWNYLKDAWNSVTQETTQEISKQQQKKPTTTTTAGTSSTTTQPTGTNTGATQQQQDGKQQGGGIYPTINLEETGSSEKKSN